MKIKIECKDSRETISWQWHVDDGKAIVQKIREMAYDAGANEKHAVKPGYRGFLLIRCENCGKVKGFHIPHKIKKYQCSCGKDTPLEGLTEATFRCPECTRSWSYWTNLTEEHIQWECVADRHEMKARWNEETLEYLPE